MPGKSFFTVLAFLTIISSQWANTGSLTDKALQRYRQADSLLNLPNPTDDNNKESLKGFEEVISILEKNSLHKGDSLLFLCYRNKGILMDIEANYPAARDAYCKALTIQKLNNSPSDSLIIMTFINVGGSYYYLNNFDSASYFLLKAESLINRFPGLEYKVRLYNTLGVLYHDNGNYFQCKNYFSQALEIIKSKKPFDTISAVSVEINIATSFSRLGQYDEALSIYKKMLRYNLFNSYIYMNMGRANTSLNKYEQALDCFRKVSVSQLPWVLNEVAYTQLQLRRFDSAAYYLRQVQVSKNAGRINVADRGINKLYFAELKMAQQDYLPALDSLQRAIIIFSGNFNNTDIYSNPTGFTSSFSYYRLFTALSRKAMAFNLLYKQTQKEAYLLASLNTYNSTMSLLSYIEKSYDTDDAKILLKKKSRPVYQEALSVCLELFKLHPEKNYLEQAFQINEKNKASIILATLNQRSFTNIAGVDEGLLQKERNIKYNIARLNLQGDQARDIKEIEAIASEKANYEIELGRIQKTLEQNNRFYKLKYDDRYPDIKELQKYVAPKQALISFYSTDSSLHAFFIGQNSFQYTRIDSLQSLETDIKAWLQLLQNTESGRKFGGEKISQHLYSRLIQPIQKLTAGIDEWVIIPDGILHFLPFESLPADGSTSLLETTTISYQFSSRFITRNFSSGNNSNGSPYKILAFAPFSRKGTDFNRKSFSVMNQLPSSEEEILNLNGKKYTDSQATKEKFLQEINKYPIVHLATHAVADESNSSNPFIAFYPKYNSLTDDCLFVEELYGLKMDSTQLVIISACETGKGELVNSEGVISLSRAFIYAGCASTINSLWKADDKATSSILKQFHYYLQKGYTKSKALQKAKLDYIKSDALNKSPAYWSHLIIVGNTEPLLTKKQHWWVAFIIVVLFVGISALRNRK